MKLKQELFNIAFSSIFLALAYVLPFLTGQIPQIGAMLCPMHIPVLLCGFICGWKYGLIIGVLSPLIRSLTLGMPPLFPNSLCMSFELATYGLLAGLLYKYLPKNKLSIYISLIIAMLIGRVVWGMIMFICFGFNINKFGIVSFWTSAFVNAGVGIILQIILVPIIVMAYEKIINKFFNQKK